MVVRKVDVGTGDIKTSGIQFATGVDEIAQTVATRLRLFRGEYLRDITAGVPWFQEVFLGKVADSKITSIIRRIILQTDGVLSIKEYSFEVQDRQFIVKAVIVTDSGEVEINELIRQ